MLINRQEQSKQTCMNDEMTAKFVSCVMREEAYVCSLSSPQ